LFPTIDSPGSYVLYIEDLTNGCIDSASVSIDQDITLPDVYIVTPDTLNCAVQQLSLTGQTTTTNVPLSFSWSTQDGAITGPSDTLSAMVNQPGLYTLSILNTENGCLDSTSIVVLQDTIAPEATIDVPSTLNCDVLEVTLNSTADVPVSYNWSSTTGNILTDTTLPSIEVDAPGDYSLTVLSLENGCEATLSMLVQQDTIAPELSILPPEVLTCDLLEFLLDASGSSGGPDFEATWTAGGGGNIVEGASSLMPLIDAPGSYQLTILNTENGCSQSQSISVLEDVVLPTANAGDDFILPCFEEFTELDGSASSTGVSYTYEWTSSSGNILSGSNSIAPVIDAPGLYNLLVTNTSNGCESTDMVQVIQDIPVAMVSSIQPLCHDDNGQINITTVSGGIGPYVYAIDGGNNFFPGSNFTNLEPGAYDVVVQDVNGCEDRTAISIEQPDSVIVIATEPSAELLFGESYQILLQTNIPTPDIQAIQWQEVPGLSCYDCLNPIATPNQTTDYRVLVTSINGCSDEAFLRIFVDKGRAIYIPNIFSPNGDGSNDRFYVFAKAGTIDTIEDFQVYSRWGEPLFERKNIPPNNPEYGWDGMFRGQMMNSGVFTYFAKVKFTDGRVELFKGDITLFR
jgi:gliding motility-associated-like protein